MIDLHTHLADYRIYSPSYLQGMITGTGIQSRKLNALLKAFLLDTTGEQHLKQMDQAGIERSVLLIIDSAIGMESPVLGLEEVYELHRQVLTRHPDRFCVFAGIDPRRGKKGYELFVKSIETYGFRGLKLYPPMGYAMDHPDLIPVYEYCDKYKLPILIHTGDSLLTLDREYSKVANALKIVSRFPGISFILAHAGYHLQDPGIEELSTYPNVYFDLAGVQALFDEDDFDKQFPKSLLEKSAKNIVFGSDWPLFSMASSLQKQVAQTRKLLAGLNLSQSQTDDIMNGQNANHWVFGQP